MPGYIIIAVILIALVGAILIYAATRPDDFRVERSASIKAPTETIHALISDFHAWRAWSPYEKFDPEMTRSFAGAGKGKGAVYEWSGNRKVGAGRMEIIEDTPARIVAKLDFIRPFEAHNIAEFVLRPEGDATRVTWSMRGLSPFVAKVMGLFVNMDRMIGKDFEAGLANLKAAAEAK
jgi:hypothetical protein